MDLELLQKAAIDAAERAYAPYSHFHVGAALLTLENEIISGVNVENRSYGLTNCAERTAIFTALARGFTQFQAMAIFSPDSKELLPPCGACRQVLSEFTDPDFPVYLHGEKGWIKVSMGELLPLDSLQNFKD